MPRAATTNAKRSRIPPTQSYLFRIEQFEPHYSFGTTENRFGEAGFGEYLHPEIETVCLAPSKFEGRKTRFTILGDRHLLKGGGLGSPSTCIGTLTFRGDWSTYLGPLPFDAALALPAVILLQGYRFIYLSGEPTRHGSARIRSMGFYREFDLADL